MGTSGKVNNCGLCSCQLFWKDLPGPAPLTQTEQISAGLERDPRVPFFSCCFYYPFISCLLPKLAQLRCADLWTVTRMDSVTLLRRGEALYTVFPEWGKERDLSRRGEREGDLRVLCKVWTLIHLLNPTAEGSLFISKHQGFILFYFIFFSGRPFRSW